MLYHKDNNIFSHSFESFHYLITFVKNALKTITYEKIPFLYFLHPPCGQSYATLPESLASIAQSAGNTNANTDVPEYLYNGKEKQAFETAATNYLDYGARFYNPVIIKWNTQDPMAEKYYSLSPFSYCSNNPSLFIDPTGEKIIFVNGLETKNSGECVGERFLKKRDFRVGCGNDDNSSVVF